MSGQDATLQASADLPSCLRKLWAFHLSVLAALLLLLLVLNAPLVNAALTVWRVSPTYSHCFFIVPISGFLIWLRRKRLAGLAPKTSPAVLLLAVPVLGLQLAGAVLNITEVQQFALVTLVEILAFSLLGAEVFRVILFPMLFLFFLVPTGEYLVGPMQNFTTWFISAGLTALGILHHTEGTIIEMVGGTFRVAEACAGLRFLIATVAIGALFCHLNYRSWWKSSLYMLASLTVPVIANGFRALGIVLLAHYSNNKIATGADHLIYGWGFSVAILSFLMFVGSRFADPPSAGEEPSWGVSSNPSWKTLALAAGGAVIVVLATPVFAYWTEHRPGQFNPGPIVALTPNGDWVRTKPVGHWAPLFPNSDGSVRLGLEDKNKASKVDLTVYYYTRSRRGHGLISSTNGIWDQEQWHLLARGNRQVSLAGQAVPMEELVLTSGQTTELIWWAYWVNGKFTTKATEVKLANLQTLLAGSGGSAFVAVSVEVDSDLDVARDKLLRATANLGVLPTTLDRAAGINPRKGAV